MKAIKQHVWPKGPGRPNGMECLDCGMTVKEVSRTKAACEPTCHSTIGAFGMILRCARPAHLDGVHATGGSSWTDAP